MGDRRAHCPRLCQGQDGRLAPRRLIGTVILMRRDSLAAQLAARLKWLPPACLSGRRVGWGGGRAAIP